MFTIIENNKRRILVSILLILLLPLFVFLEDVIMTIGQCLGTALRMYVEGVCVK